MEEKKEEVTENTTASEKVESVQAEGIQTEGVQAEVIQSEVNAAGGVHLKPRGDKVLTKKQKQLRTVLRWTLMNIGIIMMSCSVFFFQVPNNFSLGGVGGISIVLAMYLPLSQATIMAIINVFLIILGLVILGKQCTFRTIYCSLMYTAIIFILEKVVPKDFCSSGVPLTNQPMLELVYAILLFGVGGALIFNCGATSGGTDIIALILKKFTNMNVGISLMIVDFVVVCVSFYTFDVNSALFSLLGLFTKSFLLDGVIESVGKTKYITIITTHPDAISDYILNVIQHGLTTYDAQGGYTGEQKKVLITICKRGEALKLKAKVKELDEEAFVIITDANEILGKGFGGTI
jgi:uncharacterized membrane-anchored protein YitT (DUF2179 family)